MSYLEKPKLKLKIELEVPDLPGAPSRKFVVSRSLKAKWCDDYEKVTSEILNEIKHYKGSFIGDTVFSLNNIVKADGGPIKEDSSRSTDVTRWASQIIDTLLFFSIKEGLHKELIENTELTEWDGTTKDIGPIEKQEIENSDIEKLMLLLAPKIKHALFLMSKSEK